jgi:hypothetical protein
VSAIWHIPEGFATLVAGLLVVVATALAWYSVQRQIRATERIEATKLRLDLYNRRYHIFDSIFDFYDALIGWTGTPEQRAAQKRFFRASQEAAFLFKLESGIEKTLKRLHEESAKVFLPRYFQWSAHRGRFDLQQRFHAFFRGR